MEFETGRNDTMEVHAKSKFDYETIKELTHRSSFRIIKPRAMAILIAICNIIVFWLFIESYLYYEIGANDFSTLIVILIGDGVLAYIYWGVPKIRYKALGKLQNLENEYIFGDETIKISNKSEEFNAEGEIKYTLIPKVMETPKYIFIYQNMRSVYIIDKATITNGTIEDIRAKLAQYVPQKKYIVKHK